MRYNESAMPPLKKSDYIAKLKERRGESRIYQKHQLVGLEIAGLLGDKAHKSLYIKLARENDGEALLRLAREISRMGHVAKKGAYFMSCVAAKKSGSVWVRRVRNGKTVTSDKTGEHARQR